MTTDDTRLAGESDSRFLLGLIVIWTLGALLGIEAYVGDGNTIGLIAGAMFLLMAVATIGQILRRRLST